MRNNLELMYDVTLSAGILLADRATKHYVEKHPDRFSDQKKGKGWIRLKLYHNRGIAGGSLEQETRRITVATGMLLAAIFVRLVCGGTQNDRVRNLGLACLLGGGIGNWIDRISRGAVTDYLGFPKLPGKAQYLLFNVADFFVFLGGILVVLPEFRRSDEE